MILEELKEQWGNILEFLKVWYEAARWRDFKTEPPVKILREENCILAASRSEISGKWLIDCAEWTYAKKWKRDFFNESPIEKWRPIGPMPDNEKES